MRVIPSYTINSVMSKYLIVIHKVYQNGINGIVWYMFWYWQRQVYRKYHLSLDNGILGMVARLVSKC